MPQKAPPHRLLWSFQETFKPIQALTQDTWGRISLRARRAPPIREATQMVGCCTQRKSRGRVAQTGLRLGGRGVANLGGVGCMRIHGIATRTRSIGICICKELHPSSCAHFWVAAVWHHHLGQGGALWGVRRPEKVPVGKRITWLKDATLDSTLLCSATRLSVHWLLPPPVLALALCAVLPPLLPSVPCSAIWGV